MTKLINYVGYLEHNYYMLGSIDDAHKRCELEIDGLQHNGVLDEELAEALREINNSMARVARTYRRRRR